MKILLISDVEDPYLWDHFDMERYRDIDLVISCGDLKAEFLTFLVTLIHVPLLYVPGNHDSTYADEPPEGCENIDGRLVTVDGLRILGFGGSHMYNHGPNQYTQKEMNRKVRRLKWAIHQKGGFDILVAHAPALGIHDAPDPCHMGFSAFLKLIDRYHPRFFVHGHQHLNYGANSARIQVHGATTVINAYRHYILMV